MSVTAKAVLFAEADPASAAGSSPGWKGTLQRLGTPLATASAAARATVERELSAVLSRLLDQDLGQIVVAGLRHHPALIRAARATEADAAAVEVVQLAAHQITSSHHPYVDVVIDGVKLATVHFDLDLTFDIDVLVATVRQARLMNVQSGHCTVTVALGAEGHPVASRQVPLDLAVTVRLGDGIDLLTDQRRPAPAQGTP
jgi:hypothetical protein